jgi:uncharacterized protein (DUF1810 family)
MLSPRRIIMTVITSLERFKHAQDDAYSGFESALAELQNGRKQGHWIWYVFPQLSGLGASSLSRSYGIGGVSEAMDYLRDPVLCSRLLTITTVVAGRLGAGVSLEALMASSIDALKLVSSLTLFGDAARRLYAAEGNEAHASLARVAAEVLALAASGGYPACRYTLARLAGRDG